MDSILSADLAQLGLNTHATVVTPLGNLSGSVTVLRIRQFRAVIHNRGKAQIDRRATQIEILSVIKVRYHRDFCLFG